MPSTVPSAVLSEPIVERPLPSCSRSSLGTFDECPLCGGAMEPEHAHFRCGECGWRDSCCD